MAKDGKIAFEEGSLWQLPSNVLDEEASSTKMYLRQQHGHRPKLPAEPLAPYSKSSSRPHHTPKFSGNRASGMQAIFLDSGQKSGGTGVFLPQRAGTKFQPTKKPGCSPVLLPSRVVQALNLNVQAIGLHVSPRQDTKIKNNSKGDHEGRNVVKNKNNGKDFSRQCSQNRSSGSSTEVFLPKEWTY